jgi:long-subunit acyl-CoA synthetase (AMP-forming)
LSLLESSHCGTLVVAPEGAPIIYKEIIAKRPMRVEYMPDLDTFLNVDDKVAPYPFKKKFDEARLDPLIIMHTSGSTGFPNQCLSSMERRKANDIIAFSSGEKTNPITFEETMAAHPAVRAAFVGGNNEFQASLLIESTKFPESEEEKVSLIDELWPTVVSANQDCPAHARVLKSFIMLATPDKPFPRAGKETIQRASIPELYAEEFEQLYTTATKAKDAPIMPQQMQEFKSKRRLARLNS